MSGFVCLIMPSWSRYMTGDLVGPIRLSGVPQSGWWLRSDRRGLRPDSCHGVRRGLNTAKTMRRGYCGDPLTVPGGIGALCREASKPRHGRRGCSLHRVAWPCEGQTRHRKEMKQRPQQPFQSTHRPGWLAQRQRWGPLRGKRPQES